MPKQTFFNLSDDKRGTLMAAAQKEFSRVPFAEASIANIVKDAEIPRGSFYQYFHDKEDLFYYLLSEHAKERQTGFITSLRKHQGDIFEAMSEIFQSMLIELDDDELRGFYQNIFLHLNYKTEKTIVNSMSNYEFNNKLEEIKSLINMTNLNVENDRELSQIGQIISALIMQNFVLKFAKELSNEEVIQNYQTQLQLLKKGFIKKG